MEVVEFLRVSGTGRAESELALREGLLLPDCAATIIVYSCVRAAQPARQDESRYDEAAPS